MLNMDLPCRRKRGRPQRQIMDVVKDNMHIVGVTKEDIRDGVRGRIG